MPDMSQHVIQPFAHPCRSSASQIGSQNQPAHNSPDAPPTLVYPVTLHLSPIACLVRTSSTSDPVLLLMSPAFCEFATKLDAAYKAR